MNKYLRTNWFIWLASMIPGLGLILLGKKKLGFGIIWIVCFLIAVFWFIPNIITWFIFGIAFIAQLAYAVGLATIQAIDEKDVTPNSKINRRLPLRFSDKKHIVAEVNKSLSTILGSNEQLVTAVVGTVQNSSRSMFVGVTQDHLILSECSQAGNPSKTMRIPIDSVSWVSLLIWIRNALLTIEYEDEQKITLLVPGKLREQAKLIVNEFPGTWTMNNFTYDLDSYKPLDYRRGALIVYIGCIAIMVRGINPIDVLEPSLRKIATDLIISLLFFIVGWPQFVSFVRHLKKEPEISSINSYTMFSLILTFVLWVLAINTTGIVAVAVVRYLQRSG